MVHVSRDREEEYGALAAIASALAAGFLLVHTYAHAIRIFGEHHAVWGRLSYLLLNILDALVAPGVTLPLIPVATQVWGPTFAALSTTVGWTTGSLAAFAIARRWGAPVVRRLVSLQRVQSMQRYVPQDLFWSIVLLRLVLPMDVISYVLGLFTRMDWLKYAAATALGLTPSAFLLAYVGNLPHGYHIIALAAGVTLVVGAFLAERRPRDAGAVRGR